ncbi:anti-sigma28 factor (negative regulator of flagellin synthesis) [Staphylococcus warneri]
MGIFEKTLNKGDLSLKKFLFLSGTALLLLSACNNGDSSSDSKGASKVEDTQKSEDSKKGNDSKSSSSKESSSHSSKSKQSSTNDISNLSEKERIALIFLANESGKYTLTKNDILTGRYTTQMSDEKKTQELKHFAVSRETQQISGAPNGMKFYAVSPSIAQFATVIGVSDDKIYLGGTQSPIPSYKDALKFGEEHNTKEVYDKYKDSNEFKQVANKINLYDKMPTFSDDESDDSSSDDNSSSDSSSDSEEVTRDNVIDKVESYEGEKLDTDTYTFKEPEKTSDGKWGFSYDDKDGNLAGSYTVDTDDGYVTKFDENGDKIGSGY